MQQVLVLNASYEPLNVTSVRRAHVLVFKGKAEVIEELDRPLHSATDTYSVAARDQARRVRARAACGSAQDLATRAVRTRRLALRLLRHDSRAADARPCHSRDRAAASRYGRTSSRRARRATTRRETGTLEEARMELVHPPRAPAPVLFIRLAAPKIPNGWQPYLAHFGSAATSTA